MLLPTIIMLLIHLLANACIFTANLVCRVLFTTYVMLFMAELCESRMAQEN